MIELELGPIRRGTQLVLQPASLRLPALGTVGVVGVNGAGKTTLFHALAHAFAPRAASASLAVGGDGRAVAYAPQQPAFPPWLRVEHVARLYGFGPGELVERYGGLLLEELAGRRAGALSVGQAQVLSVALALAQGAPLTILDEPFASLDFRRRYTLVQLLQHARSPGAHGLTLVSSQNAADLLDTCDWIVVLRAGRFVFSGRKEELMGSEAESEAGRQRFEQAIVTLLTAAGTVP